MVWYGFWFACCRGLVPLCLSFAGLPLLLLCMLPRRRGERSLLWSPNTVNALVLPDWIQVTPGLGWTGLVGEFPNALQLVGARPPQPKALEPSMHKVYIPELYRRAVGVGVRGLREGLHLHLG